MKKNYRRGIQLPKFSSSKSKFITKGLFFTLLGLSVNTFAQTQTQKTQITKNYNKSELSSLQQKYNKQSLLEKQNAIKAAKENGWDIIVNLPNNGGFAELQRLTPDGKPVYYTISNVDAARSTRTNHINSGGSLGLNLDGQNMTAHVWDGGGTRITHQEFDGPGGNNRVSIIDGSTLNSNSFHAQHVTGTIVASGVQANAKGMAPQAKAKTSDWSNDKAEATAEASNGMLISNHSYGFAFRNQQGQVQLPQHYFGGYIDESRDWDEILFNAPNYLMVVAAGNDGNDNSANNNPTGGAGFDKLTGHSTSKNNLVVANAQDANINASGDLVSVAINSSSSEGPTDDFRIKPDITGNGTGVYSTYDNSDTAYNSISGTSMASPNVTGSLLLLQQHYNNLNNTYMKAATLKGIALHTASDAGVNGPDAVFGWGLLNAKAAAETITNRGDESKIEELTLSSGQTYTITVDADGSTPLLASISWTDRPGTSNTTVNSTTPVLVNDLDIRVSKGGTTHLPYKLTGALSNSKADNNVDPYERVDVANASGTYIITVTHKGSLTGGSQDFSLIVSGLTGTPVVCNATTPTGVSSTDITATSATINWTAVAGASYDVRHRILGSSSWTTNAVNTATASLTGLTASSQYEVQVRSKCSSGNSSFSSSINFTTPQVQLNYCTSNGDSVSDEYIGRVQIGSINNASNGASSGYADFTSISTNLAKGEAHTITITPTWTGTTYDEGYGVWIDYNKDGDFNDPNEQVYTAAASKTTPVSGSFNIPDNATEGATRMRVILRYNTTPTSCGNYNYGETEDYTVVIESAQADTQAPTIPTNLAISNITQTTATLNWAASTDNVGVTGYEIFSGATSIGTVTGTSTNITSLTANTSYSYTIKAKDAAGNISASSNAITFTTLPNAVTYCASSGNRTTYEWIDYVALGGMTNSTGANGGYGDFTSKVATIAKGSAQQITLSAGFSSTAYTEFWKVWIDYNQNGTFENNEEVATGSSSSAANLTGDFTVPSNAITGQTRMRVSMKYNAAPTSCEAFGDGEVEDYTVNITNTTTAIASTDITSIDSTELGNEGISFDFAMYPNPATQNTISINLTGAKNVSYTIKNMLGQTVKSNSLSNTSIYIGELQSGLYLVEISDGQKSITKKLLKQ